AALNRLALRWRRQLGADVRVVDAAATGASVGGTVEALQAAGCTRVDVAAWFLAPGLLLDRATAQAFAAGAGSVAAPLGAAPEVVATVLRRFDAVAVGAARVA
ncbi:CbiX/SirB N-terminal domain-containing protein, partial [Sporichthya sp.]|uniref:CbiX/SirB N-terminal domain-containing protein n=1 Tax=Sporichthya sp. TaxID=65475 RepID=UPI00179C7FDC